MPREKLFVSILRVCLCASFAYEDIILSTFKVDM